MGTPEFAVPSLEILLRNNYNILAVVTAPDKPAGRGRNIRQSAVKQFALDRGLEVLQPENLKDPEFYEKVKGLHPNLLVVVAFRMLPQLIWKYPEFGTFNLHASLLPQYRGAAPINHAIINGEQETGLTTFFLDEKIDTGQILYQKKTLVGDHETAGQLHDRLMLLGAGLVLKTVRAIEYEEEVPVDQKNLIPYTGPLKPAPKIKKDDCHIQWDKRIKDVYNFIRGMSPYPAAFSYLKQDGDSNKMLKIFFAEKTSCHANGKPGSMLTDHKNYIRVNCRDKQLDLQKIQLEGKKPMTVQEFLHGNPIKNGRELV